jgi:hypothetical protein
VSVPGQTLPANRALLMGYELVGASEEDFGRQVPKQFATEGALDGDGLKRKFFPTGRNVAAALLAGDDEGFAISGHLEHASMIDE